MIGRKISTETILYIFTALFPIIPSYFSVFGFGGTNFISLLFVLLIILIKKGNASAFRIHFNYLTFSLLLWIVCHFLSMAVTNNIIQAAYFLLSSVFVCFTLLPLIRNANVFLNVVGVIVKTSGVVAVFGVVEEFWGINVFGLINTTGVALNYNSARFGMTRIISYSSHAIVYGVYLIFCLSLSFYYLQNIDATKEKRITKLIYVLLWINVILTFSRSAILFAAFSQILLLYFSGFNKFLITTIKIVASAYIIGTIASIIVPKVGHLISNFTYMILAVFNDNYRSLAEGVFSIGKEADATGNRLELYQWVFETLNSDKSWVFGHNLQDTFRYSRTVTDGIYSWTNIKQSLEVQYLSLLYYYGLVGMIPEVLVYIALFVKSVCNRAKAVWEKNLGFNTVAAVTLGTYFLMFFVVNQSSDKNIFYLFVMLFLAYNSRVKYMGQT